MKRLLITALALIISLASSGGGQVVARHSDTVPFGLARVELSEQVGSELDRDLTPYSEPSEEARLASGESRQVVERKRVNQVVAINALFLILAFAIFYLKKRARRTRQ